MPKSIATATLALGLAVLLGFAWFSATGNAAMLDLSTASRLPGSGLVGGTIWWP